MKLWLTLIGLPILSICNLCCVKKMDLECSLKTAERLKRIQKAVLQRTNQYIDTEDPFIYLPLLIAEFAPHVADSLINGQPGMNTHDMRTAIFRAGGHEIPDTDPLYLELAIFEEGMRIVYEIIQESRQEHAVSENVQNVWSASPESHPWWHKLLGIRRKTSATDNKEGA